MSAPVDALVAVLAAQTAQLQALLGLLEQERTALIRMDAPMVHQVAERKGLLIASVQQLETERDACLRRLAAEHGLPEAPLTLSALARRLGAPARLIEAGQDLRAALGRVAAMNDGNRVLADHALRHVRGLLDRVRGVLTEAPTYGRAGQPAGEWTRPVLEHTA
jgi:flagellar biosynthesis/type III secretory pathway chaperone